ncbi:hypothetical protein E0H26_26980 [Micromonospora zingiberis]|uniref:Uncharacterized protein n=1 Tax=Micromonospora zingiberis TaxID=2053011 RepID=A0A4R0G1R9_9ACTN|nr:hypothetical protein [Micromonospora zingiberis]TCB90470.1 hypothetical protein E0H26_26980 [Micromonospora zingiberis]
MLEQLSLFDPAFCQRWRGGNHTWRPVREGGFDQRRYRLAPVPEAAARRFVAEHHYSKSFPAARMSFGLLEGDHLVGAVVLGVPMHPAVLTKPFPTLGPGRAAEISRLVLLDEVPSNAESWVLGQLFRLAAEQGIRGLVAFSDPMPRILGGAVLMPGHVGHVYRVTRGKYLGRGTARTVTILPNGTVLTARAVQKVRAGERGAAGVRARLMALGARPLPEMVAEYARAGADLTPGEWLELALAQIGARRVRHRGCHRFVWPVGDKGWRRRCPIGLVELPYPLATDPAVTL